MRFTCAFALALGGCAAAPAIDESKVVDLTYPFNDQTVYWPTAEKFGLTKVAWGMNESGWWYASNDYCASEHGGTHMDAPIHFAAGGWTTAEVPVNRLIGPARVIDIREQCQRDRNYLVSVQDIERYERRYGPIAPGDVVLIRTGFGRFYPELKRYLGSDVRGKAEGLSFPGISQDAARALVERKVDAVGLDTASLDHGPSKDFRAHRVLLGANIPGLENVANLDRLPPKGATIVALPMKIDGGTGGPCRIIAILP